MRKSSSDDSMERQQGSAEPPAGPRFLIIGRLLRPHGVRGEVRTEIITELPERFEWLKEAYLSRDPDDPQPQAVPVEGVRFHQNQVLLKLGGYETREAVDALRQLWLMVPLDEAIPLEEGEYYVYQMEGMSVYTDEGEYLGQLMEIIETRANDVYLVQQEVDGQMKELLLPDIDEVILDVDVESKRMTVHLLDGLRD